MPTLQYPYKEEIFVDSLTKKPSSIFRPLIPLKLGYGGKITHFDILYLLDTGADRNLFPSDLFEYLGGNLKKGKVGEHTGIGGSHEITYEHTVSILLQGKKIRVPVCFGENITVPLLGRNTFFNEFTKITFHQKNHRVELEY